VKRYPLAAKMSKNAFVCKPEFSGSKSSKTCEKVYKIAASMQSARNFCEEYIAAQIWPLKKGWSFIRFHEKTARGKVIFFQITNHFARRNILKMHYNIPVFPKTQKSQLKFFSQLNPCLVSDM
jgi:DNA modification methylase